jgi:hypothetical protein
MDKDLKGMIVVFNASDEATVQTVPGTAGLQHSLHPVQANGSDPLVKTAVNDPSSGSFTVPARTVAVFQAK